MTTRNRETLRGFFSAGMLPTQDHFGDLIESMLNMDDEGFRKSAKNGVEVSTLAGNDALMSFYRPDNKHQALWSVAYGSETNQLVFKSSNGSVDDATPTPPTLTLDARNRVGVGTADPQHALDVAGTIACHGRIGKAAPGRPMADGEWHDLTGTLRGCQAFEVMAGAGRPNDGRFALLHATALNAYNPGFSWLDLFGARRRIRQQSMWYDRRCDQLELRWSGTQGRDATYTLQVRSKCHYGAGVPIRATVTRLWVDDETQGAAP